MNNYLIIDDWYEEDTLKKVMKELDYLSCTPMVRSEESSESARTSNGISKTKHLEFFQNIYIHQKDVLTLQY